MDTETLTLAAFLEARIAEDEAAAREVIAEFARIDWAPGHEPGAGDDHSFWACVDGQSLHVAVGAERVLREVKAKRAMMYDLDVEKGCLDVRPSIVEVLLRHLAAVYADHPDYDEEWRP